MRVLVNAVSTKEGGAVTVLKKLLPAMAAERPDISWIAAINPKVGDLGEFGSGKIASFTVSTDRSIAHLMWWYEIGLPAAIHSYNADILFSVTNYLPRRTINVPSVLLVQHAGHFSMEFQRLRRVAFPSAISEFLWRQKTRWVLASVLKSDALTVQTSALADALAAETKRPRSKIHVIPHGPGWLAHREQKRFSHDDGPWRIGYVAIFQFYKEYLTLLRAIKIVHSAGWPVVLVLTLARGAPQVEHLFSQAHAMGIGNLIENKGEVAGESLTELYDSLDVFTFPSLCESFGMPMVEAMARGLPMVVAGTPENLEVTGNAALGFVPGDANELARQIVRLLSDLELRQVQAARSLERARSFSWERAARETIAVLEAAKANSR